MTRLYPRRTSVDDEHRSSDWGPVPCLICFLLDMSNKHHNEFIMPQEKLEPCVCCVHECTVPHLWQFSFQHDLILDAYEAQEDVEQVPFPTKRQLTTE